MAAAASAGGKRMGGWVCPRRGYVSALLGARCSWSKKMGFLQSCLLQTLEEELQLPQ